MINLIFKIEMQPRKTCGNDRATLPFFVTVIAIAVIVIAVIVIKLVVINFITKFENDTILASFGKDKSIQSHGKERNHRVCHDMSKINFGKMLTLLAGSNKWFRVWNLRGAVIIVIVIINTPLVPLGITSK